MCAPWPLVSSICDFDGHALTVGPESVKPSPELAPCFGQPEQPRLSLTRRSTSCSDASFRMPSPFTRPSAQGRGIHPRRVRERNSVLWRNGLPASARLPRPTWRSDRQVTVGEELDHVRCLCSSLVQYSRPAPPAPSRRKLVLRAWSSIGTPAFSALGIGLGEETAIEASDAECSIEQHRSCSKPTKTFAKAWRNALNWHWTFLAKIQLRRARALELPRHEDGTGGGPVVLERMLVAFEHEHRAVRLLRPRPSVAQSLRLVGRRRARCRARCRLQVPPPCRQAPRARSSTMVGFSTCPLLLPSAGASGVETHGPRS